ncbi:hypothetical protein AB4851_08300 [Burkholderia sp. 22PA0099]|uniref:hypothetical protein n=1 Tax=Burkholderia sp. 22PA0099 TaxID=3237372 RepID=UPI0039C066FE
MNISLRFRLNQDTLPPAHEQLTDMWKVACLLEPLGFPIDQWFPPADTPENSKRNPAFDANGPTPAAVAVFGTENVEEEHPGLSMFAVWNGKEGPGGASFDLKLSVLAGNPVCNFSLIEKKNPGFDSYALVRDLVVGLLDIWPAASIEVGPNKYFMTQQVFPKKPGAGWMLYLPLEITKTKLPEAAELVPVMRGRKRRGTIIVSVASEVFSSENRDHVETANAIEIRLSDQGLLPLFKDTQLLTQPEL